MRNGDALASMPPPSAFFMPPRPPTAAGDAAEQRSAWHSPVPYLFGGLAAMLGLVAFALLILACSYCRTATARFDAESGGSGDGGDDEKPPKEAPAAWEDKILVIMAGNDRPTFLATPAASVGEVAAAAAVSESDAKAEKFKEMTKQEGCNSHDR